MNTDSKIAFGFKIRTLILSLTVLLSIGFSLFNVSVLSINLNVFFIFLSIVVLVNLMLYTWNGIIAPYNEAMALAKEIGKGNTTISIVSDNELTKSLIEIKNNFNEAAQFSLAIGDGSFDKKLEHLNANEGLGFALNEMSIKLQNVAEEDRKRNWVFNGEAKFGDVLRNNQDKSFEEVSFIYLKELIKYLGANQGGVYLINNEDTNNPFIELIASYAFERRKYLKQHLDLGQGLIGQCIFDKDYVYLDDIPDEYIKITSGLGDANPRSILIVPLLVNEIVLGAIEIASFQTLEKFEIEFVFKIAQTFATTVSNMQINANTQLLLEESRKATAELKAKEDDLRENSKELIKIQEELNEKLVEIERESAYTQSIVTAINSTNASLVMDMEGNILDVNEMFLSIMEYTREELIGQPEIRFVAEDEITTERYQMMIDSVKGGAYNSGEFRRISKTGRELWISGSYSPIFDINGNAYKMILFAQFTTEQKERELELKSKIEAINNSIATIELGLDLSLITANTIFLRDFGYKRLDIRNKKLDFVLQPGYAKSDEFTVLWDLIKEDNVISQPVKMITKDGQVKHYIANFSPTRNLVGEVYKVLVILIDLTEQNLLKEQLDLLLREEKRKNALLGLKIDTNESEFAEEIAHLLTSLEQVNTIDTLENLLDKKKVPVVEFDNKQEITLVNESFTNLLGFKSNELKGESLFDFLFMSQDDAYATIQKINANELCQFKLKFKTLESNLLYLNVYVIPVKINDDNFRYVMLVVNEEPNITLV